MKTVEQEFAEMMDAACPEGCPAWQREDMRKAFFGGMAALMALMSEHVDSPPPWVAPWGKEVYEFGDGLTR